MNAMTIGMSLREYPMQSVEHTLKKVKNMGIAFEKLRKFSGHGRIYVDNRYERYLEDGEQAIIEMFKESYAPEDDHYFIDDALPMKKAIKFSEEAEDNVATKFFSFVGSIFK